MKFEKQFNSFYPTLRQISIRFSRTTGIPVEEFESTLCEEFYLKYAHFDPQKKDSFTAYMRVVLTQRAMRMAGRKETEFYRKEELFVGQEDSSEDGDDVAVELEIVDEFNLEEYVASKAEHKTDADKRQLINALSKNTDSVTKKIITEYLRSENAKPTAIGKAIGIHHQVVKRKVKKLARNFNESEFGNIEAYLAV